MTLDKAIEILEYHRDAVGEVAGTEFANAIKLGIEALEEFARARRLGPPLPGFMLPGETQEPPQKESPHQEAVTQDPKRGTK